MKCREDVGVVKITHPKASEWEYFYPNELDKLDRLDKVWAEKVKEFHKKYYSSGFEAPLVYIVFYGEDDNIVSVIAVSLFANEFDRATPEVVFVDVDEWFREFADP